MRITTGVIGWCVAVMVAAPAASAACPYEDVRPDATNLEQVRAAVVCLHNAERKASGVKVVRSNTLLDDSAKSHSADMVARRYFEHETPDGLDPFERMKRVGYIRKGIVWNAGENIAWGSGALSTPRSIFDAWMKSSGQRLTLLASDLSELGVGISLGAPSEEYEHLKSAVTYTVDFGWQEPPKVLDACLRRAARARAGARRRIARAKCRYHLASR